MNNEWITIKGARENNLKNIDVKFPRNKMTVVTGVSGSGKSSLIFDIFCQEAERKFISATGKVPDKVQRPDYDNIYGLAPIISVSQNNYNNNPRSTVGTYSEIYTYLRLLYTAIGIRRCPGCGENIELIRMRSLSANMNDNEKCSGEVFLCPKCKKAVENITMAHFSFNKSEGACEKCMGLGYIAKPIFDKIVDNKLSIKDGGIKVWKKGFIWHFGPLLVRAAKYYNIPFEDKDLEKPIGDLDDIVKHLIFFGTDDPKIRELCPEKPAPSNMKEGKYEGALNSLMRRYDEEAQEDEIKDDISEFFELVTCGECNGTRLKKSSLNILVNGNSINEVFNKTIDELLQWISSLKKSLSEEYMEASRIILYDLEERCKSLCNAGLGYLSLDRSFSTLSGGEAQRMRLASLLNADLSGMVCVMDEPTAGLHPKDTDKLVGSIKQLRDIGNTVIVIEHDLDVIKQGDYIVDIGPAAGSEGGDLIFEGDVKEFLKCKESISAQCINNEKKEFKTDYRKGHNNLIIKNAVANNLKNINASILLNTVTVIAGVSGSGKSTLIFNELLRNIGSKYEKEKLEGAEFIKKTIVIDQKSMGKILRSNAATYTKVFDDIRDFFREEAKKQGKTIKASDFSFNVPGGRCEVCKGTGTTKIQMHFMKDQYIICSSCKGKRYNENILKVKYKGCNIADVLDMTIKEARELFCDILKIKQKLDYLYDIGLDYLKLGQPANTLSGGEAQRIKLASELMYNRNKGLLYILDEPSRGLHHNDTQKLMNILNKIADNGNSVVIIEHNLSIIRQADWIIELGPGGGDKGGYIIAEGTHKMIKESTKSVLKEYL
ncbi:ATP-binding cassette domain-containing protein [Desnuesiella massiliensis]|uniref:ATP-binding cassette domain-containing protein n=1 Tax=Desnuesiella massiliensis TaxID=1650662 RepID=UPI0006E42F69|nr:excinuclease ABC subunit UvrA [Desnuesiella massiliensis]